MRDSLQLKDTHRLKAKVQKQALRVNVNQKREEVAILRQNRFSVKICHNRQRRSVHNGKEVNSSRVHMIIITIYALNIGALKYRKKTLTEGTNIQKHSQCQQITIDGQSRKKINKEMANLNNSITNYVCDRHFQNILTNDRRIHILNQYTWNILQDRAYVSPQNKP